ncbi:MAG: competence/damage-inducible protein A [Clostridia bacterium]|nr:competence/damage-inducible protein A [Clostridia bacterium]
MTCELVFVGTELLLGDILNTNAQYLSKRLAALGVSVVHQSVVGDNPERLAETLQIALSRSDAVLTTGGLGPTKDDLTKEVCAAVFGLALEPDARSLARITAFFENKGIEMPPSNAKQAMLPRGAVIFDNNNGTAPGCAMEKDGKHILILPGPPREMQAMFEESAVPYLKPFTSGVILSKEIRTFGIGESAMAQRVDDLLSLENPTVAPYAKSGEALLRVTAKAETAAEANALLAPVIGEIHSRLGDVIYGVDVPSMEAATVALFKEKGLTMATAESCTAGLVTKRITDIPGASEVLRCGFVTYAADTKEALLGVKHETIKAQTVVSEAVAAEMAIGAWKRSGASVAAAITGLAGPGPDETGRSAGLAYIASTDGKTVWTKAVQTGHAGGKGCRDYNRTVFATHVLNELRLFALFAPETRPGGQPIDYDVKDMTA